MYTVTKNCTCGNRHSLLHVWTTPGKLHDLHNRDVDHFVQQQGKLLVLTVVDEMCFFSIKNQKNKEKHLKIEK